MPNTDKIGKYSESDVMLVGAIVVGFAKMVCNIVNTTAKTHYQSHSHQELKQLVYSYILWNLPYILRSRSNIRPLDIREKLPDSWKGIESADLTDILNSFVRIRVLERVTALDLKYSKRQKWGRPQKKSPQEPTGPKSLYKPSEYYNNLTNIVNEPLIIELIFSLLSHSGMLYKLFRHMNLVSFYIIRANDRKKARNMFRTSNLTTFMNEREFINDFNKTKHVDDKTLKHMADVKARSSIENSLAENYHELFIVGGLFFQA
jgi:hypothetical protein